MTEQVVMTDPGISSLIQLAREQHDHVDAIRRFARDTELYAGKWFDRGFLRAFAGDYDAATDDVSDSMGRAGSGTCELAERIVHSRQLLDDADRTVEISLVELRRVTEAVHTPRLVTAYGGLTGLGRMETPGAHRGPMVEGSASQAIGAVNGLLATGHHLGQVAGGLASGDRLDDFVEEHRD